jgi:hypothetical protein
MLRQTRVTRCLLFDPVHGVSLSQVVHGLALAAGADAPAWGWPPQGGQRARCAKRASHAALPDLVHGVSFSQVAHGLASGRPCERLRASRPRSRPGDMLAPFFLVRLCIS